MTWEELSSLRLVLERARRFLDGREDPEAKKLLEDVGDAIGKLAAIEADHVEGDVRRVAAFIGGRVYLARVHAYANAVGESFTTCATPCPERHDTEPSLSIAEVRKAIAAMPPGATEPPEEIAERIVEDQLVDERATLPPEAPTGDLPEVEDDEESGF